MSGNRACRLCGAVGASRGFCDNCRALGPNEVARRARERERAAREAEAAAWKRLKAELHPDYPKTKPCLRCGHAMESSAPDVRLCNACRTFQESAARGVDVRLLDGPAWGEP
jgi:hypothetical protein